jgi:hypothetical protein
MDLRNVGILPQHYTASQPRRTRLETSVKASKVGIHWLLVSLCMFQTQGSLRKVQIYEGKCNKT